MVKGLRYATAAALMAAHGMPALAQDASADGAYGAGAPVVERLAQMGDGSLARGRINFDFETVYAAQPNAEYAQIRNGIDPFTGQPMRYVSGGFDVAAAEEAGIDMSNVVYVTEGVPTADQQDGPRAGDILLGAAGLVAIIVGVSAAGGGGSDDPQTTGGFGG